MSEKKAVEEYTLDHVMSVFGHCMSGPDSMKMRALQVAATNDKKEWCKQVDGQELELRIAIVLAGIYMPELKETENGGPRFLTNYDAEDAKEENVVICGACHTSCTQMGKSKRCTESTICKNISKCESKGQIHGCTQQGCSSNGVRRACMICVRHTSERKRFYIQRVGDVNEVTQTRVREAMERERAETTAGGHPVVNQAQTHKRQCCTNKTQDGRTTMIPPPGTATLPGPEVVEMIPTGRTTMLPGPRVVGMTATGSSCSKSMGRERRATWPDTGGANAQGTRNELFHEDRDEIERLTRRTTEFQKEFRRAKGAANTSWAAVPEGTEGRDRGTVCTNRGF